MTPNLQTAIKRQCKYGIFCHKCRCSKHTVVNWNTKRLTISVIFSGVTPSAQASTWAPLIITSGQAAKPCPASDCHPIHHHHHHHHCLLHQKFQFHHNFVDSSSSSSRSTVVKPRHWIDKSSHLPDIWVCCLNVLDDDDDDDENGDDDDFCDDVACRIFGYFVFKSLVRGSCSWIFNDVVWWCHLIVVWWCLWLSRWLEGRTGLSAQGMLGHLWEGGVYFLTGIVLRTGLGQTLR